MAQSKASAVSISITGDKRIIRSLNRLSNRGIRAADRKAVGQGLTVIAKAIKAEVPSHMKSVRKAIGKRFKKSKKTGLREAKVGMGVGKKKSKIAPHAHLIILGTQDRYTKAGRYTGRIEPLPAVKRGYAASRTTAKQKIADVLKKSIASQAKKEGL